VPRGAGDSQDIFTEGKKSGRWAECDRYEKKRRGSWHCARLFLGGGRTLKKGNGCFQIPEDERKEIKKGGAGGGTENQQSAKDGGRNSVIGWKEKKKSRKKDPGSSNPIPDIRRGKG